MVFISSNWLISQIAVLALRRLSGYASDHRATHVVSQPRPPFAPLSLLLSNFFLVHAASAVSNRTAKCQCVFDIYVENVSGDQKLDGGAKTKQSEANYRSS